ncbi:MULTISPECIES: IS1182 family transposase [Pseudomonadota]|uniref:IS1182 family transposase n=1 Tax=Pseudomonadota TaxID=1224 RepID=UPI000FF312A3|nr:MULTISPECIES: IS1182 family transposase [Pseudomonadota]MBF8387316.1 IS1182 family transposase [Pseudomonas aeruginosa]MBH8330541.1 IS1182 family transposase [Pseudomonas aeruginosa]MBH8430266.1 IS1182 family transposase [Pseudomonas aeruginosa]MCK1101791.1 IS1182 family transposase [Pseudomonas aeruginosa]MCK1178448.1 IS1182 family transposase [Pseudomonas aeruginosa]
MKRFIEGECRDQVTLLPECLDDFIGEDNPVRIVDAFVDELDLQALGFNRAAPASTGRPAYHPAVLLKLYIYGYLNRIQSSRRLEREAQRNVELMWLTGRLAPDFKTIADFRHHNGVGIRKVCSHFIGICRELKLFSQAIIAIDGSKFKAVNNGDNNFSNGKIEGRKRQIEQSIQRYLDALETADRTQPAEVEAKTKRLKEKIELLRLQMQKLEQVQEQIKQQPDGQISTVDPDSRVMISKGQGVVGYNVQAAVDAQNHLIVAHEVTNIGNDRAQLSKMAKAAKQEMAADNLQALADRGYFNGPEIKACEDAGIEAFVPKPLTSNAKADGRFDKSDFVYLSETDEYRCPAGESAIHRFNTVERSGLNVRVYWSSACIGCPQKSECTTSQYRRIRRWEHEDVLERMQERLNTKTDAMTVRRRTVEHVFGTLKHWMGSTHFLTKTLAHVGTEMSLHVLAYNFKRVMCILGAQNMMQALRSVPA